MGSAADWDRLGGTPLSLGEPVAGASNLFSLITPQDGWTRLEAGKIDPESDLALYGPTVETVVLAFVIPKAGSNIDGMLQARRDLIRQSGTLKEFRERRTFVTGRPVPISYARYLDHTSIVGETVYWTATVVHGDNAIQVLAYSTKIDEQDLNLKLLVESLRLTEPGAVK